MGIRVVTDSTAVLPPDLLARHRIELVPLTLIWDGDSYQDGVDITYAEFAARATSGSTPKTSAPSPGEYATVYERAIEGAEGLFVVTPPAELSATFSNAKLGAQTVDPSRIDVFDARSAAAGQGLVVLEAARAADAGGSIESIRERCAYVAERVKLVATLERLDYLRRSGRVPAVAVYATDALHLHPLFRFVQGSPSPIGASRGGRKAAERILSEFASSRPGPDVRAHAAVMHSSRLPHAQELQARILEEVPGAECHVVEITAAMAAHLGPGALGVAWWWEA